MEMEDNMRNQYKFINLSRYLRENGENTIVLKFSEIESILGEKMCKSAYNYPAYWSLSKTHTFPLAWINEGYTLKSLDLKNRTIVLSKGDTKAIKPKSIIVTNPEIKVQFNHQIQGESDIKEKVLTYYNETIKDENGRYKSWEHCHSYFLKNRKNVNKEIIDVMCLHLAFYLASWGMYRGSSFLLQKDYKVHYDVVKEILNERYNSLWNIDCEGLTKENNLNLIFEISEKIREIYIGKRKNLDGLEDVSEILISKILMGTFGCVPAFDRFLKSGIKLKNVGIQKYNKKSLMELVYFYKTNEQDFNECRIEINQNGVEYPEMKLVDMYFWQIGYDNSSMN